MTAPAVTPLSATDPVRRAVAAWLAEFALAGPLLVAVSGGADSLALAGAIAAELRPGHRQPVAVTVDHQLQAGSGEQAELCAEQLRQLGFREIRLVPVDVDRVGGMEAAARRARQQILRELAADIGSGSPCPVLLGHTLDDQAETVLLGLARGSGPRSIAGMRRWHPPWGRPLLTVRRSDTENACAAMGITPWSDPHNIDPAFTRVRLRREVLPLLEQVLGGGVAPALARTADLLADDLLALDQIADRALDDAVGADGSLSRASVLTHPPAVRRRVLRHWLAGDGVPALTSQHLFRLDALLTARSGAAVRLPAGTDVVRDGMRLSVQHRPSA